MNPIGRTMSRLAHVVGGELLLRIINAAVVVLIGRVYGATVLGMYAAILALATLVERSSDNGMELTGITEVSRHSERLSEIATSLYAGKAALSVVGISLLALVAWLTGFSRDQWVIAAILTARTFVYSFCPFNAGMLKALDKTERIVRIQAFHFSVLSVCVLAVYFGRKSLPTLLLCLLVTQLMELILTQRTLRLLGFRRKAVNISMCWRLVRSSTAVGVTYTLSTLMLRGDILVLSLVASASVVGAFAAANTALVMGYVIAWLFSGILLSDFGRMSREPGALERHFQECLRWVMLLSVVLAIVSALAAKMAIVTVFGRGFEAASVPGVLMMMALPFIFLNATFLSRAVARNASYLVLAIYGFTTLLSLFLNYYLGRWHGAEGVAASIVIREAAMTFAFVWFWKLPDRSPEATSSLERNPEFAAMLNS